MSPHSITPPYLTYFYIIPHFFNFVKNFFTLITLDIINGNLFLARGLLHSTLITKWQSHFYFLLSLDFFYIIPYFSSFVKNFFIFYGDSFLTQFIKVSGFLTTIVYKCCSLHLTSILYHITCHMSSIIFYSFLKLKNFINTFNYIFDSFNFKTI